MPYFAVFIRFAKAPADDIFGRANTLPVVQLKLSSHGRGRRSGSSEDAQNGRCRAPFSILTKGAAMQRSAGRFALVIVSTLVILAGCQAPSWMTWKKDKDPSTPLAGSTSPKSSSPGATITNPSATASSVTTSPPATGYGAPATGISNPYAVGVSGNPYAAANTSNPYAAPSAAGTAGYDASSYSSTYPSTKTPGYGASNPYAPSNPYAAAPAAATAATTVQPQNGYYAQTYPATGTSNGVIVGNPYATGGAAAATAPAPSASAALPSRYDSDDLLGPRPGAVAAVNPASTVQNNSLPAASSAQSWGTATASD